MNFIFYPLFLLFTSCTPASKTSTFVGSTPAHNDVRSFLGISQTDSVDFIRWKIVMNGDSYDLSCQYGISKGGTPGFIDEKNADFKGTITKENHVHILHRSNKELRLQEVNSNLFHLLDHEGHMIPGNGGYSYVLNNINPMPTSDFNLQPKQSQMKFPIVFEGRTPCQELSAIMNLNKGAACEKLKWYFILYADSLTGKPSYYLEGGRGYRKETMKRGTWKINMLPNGRIMYQITPDNHAYTLNLLKGDDNILFFIRPDGSLLVGNKDFSYTLNRRNKEYEPVKR